MDLFGDKLREIRTEKKFSLDQIARDTKISKKYLDAFEKNDFSIFPSETYLVGFLKSYTEYLGLDSTKYLNQYRNYKIQEQPIPINELLDIKKSLHPVVVVLLIALGAAIVAVSSILVYKYVFSSPVPVVKENPEPVKEPEIEKVTYYFEDEVDTKWFSPRDQIIVSLGDMKYTILVSDISDTMKLLINDSELELKIEEEIVLNLNNDDSVDVKIVLNEIEENESLNRAYVGLFKITAGVTSIVPARIADAGEEDDQAGEEIISADARDKLIIFEADDPAPFILSINFRGYCLFRYLLDNKTRNQKFFMKDDKIDLDVNKSVMLWISNAGSVKARIAGTDVALGKAGQVVTRQIIWEREQETKKYRLVLVSAN